MKILIVEDEIALLDAIADYLSSGGNVCAKASTFWMAEDKIVAYHYEIIILDIMLPDGNGLELLKKIKTLHPETGILIISAKNSLDDKLSGLDLGADDYITKPFHLAELNARVTAVLRRKLFNGKKEIEFREITINTRAKEVTVNSNELDLTGKEYDLLLYLINNKNRVLTRESLAEYLSGDIINMADDFDFVYTHIKNLRRKIKDAGGNDYIKNMYGIGYKLTDR